jgi:hypothetical protein
VLLRRTEAEGSGRRHDRSQLRQAEKLYNMAAAEGNAFIDLIKINLTARALAETDLQPAAKKVADTVSTLERYVSTGGEPSVSVAASPAELIAGLTEGLVNGGPTNLESCKG